MGLGRQERRGLYRPEYEHDACGVAFVATLRGHAGRDIVDAALTALANLEHRGAVGAEENTGDGAGILTQVPHAFLTATSGLDLPAEGGYAVGTAFLPTDGGERAGSVRAIERVASEEGLTVLGWRDVPIDDSVIGRQARDCMPVFRQLFVVADDGVGGLALERRAFRLRKRAQNHLGTYFSSLSSRTLVYKGMLTTAQLRQFFPDLEDPRFTARLALVHSRFSTNTFPSWPLAQPFRLLAHNGEINTVEGNRNWMAARQGSLHSELLGDIGALGSITTAGASDSASLDEVVELLHLAGRSLPHSMLMMVPEAWQNHAQLDPSVRALYEFMGTVMEPWDGPAAIAFTDGTQVGAMLDRNGLRPGRFWVTDEGLVVLASESGVLDIPAERVVRRGRLEPGRMFLVDTAEGRIVEDEEIKSSLAAAHPYQEWVDTNLLEVDDLPEREHVSHTPSSVARRQQTFGYTDEDLKYLL
nr:glutamate synthase subunit alpha [Actinomycetales bacterium]